MKFKGKKRLTSGDKSDKVIQRSKDSRWAIARKSCRGQLTFVCFRSLRLCVGTYFFWTHINLHGGENACQTHRSSVRSRRSSPLLQRDCKTPLRAYLLTIRASTSQTTQSSARSFMKPALSTPSSRTR